MSIKVVATDFIGRIVERELSEDDVHALYDGSLNFKVIVRELAKKAMDKTMDVADE